MLCMVHNIVKHFFLEVKNKINVKREKGYPDSLYRIIVIGQSERTYSMQRKLQNSCYYIHTVYSSLDVHHCQSQRNHISIHIEKHVNDINIDADSNL